MYLTTDSHVGRIILDLLAVSEIMYQLLYHIGAYVCPVLTDGSSARDIILFNDRSTICFYEADACWI